jgi:hypothetical protein
MFVPVQNQDAFDPRQPFSRAEARAAGLTAEGLLSRRFHKIFGDANVARDVVITPLLGAKAVLELVASGSYISHHTAAELWGAAPPLDGATHVTLPSACGRQVRQEVRSHYRRQPAQTTLRKSLGVYQESRRTLERVRDALRECGAVGIRRTFKPEWRHFPAR